MEAANNVDDLLVKYLLQESDSNETAFVLEWVSLQESNRQHFEQLKQTVGLLVLQHTGSINVEEEWTHLQERIAAAKTGPLPGNNSASALQETDWQTTDRRRKIYRVLLRTAVAACIIIAVGAAWLLNKNNIEVAPLAAGADSTAASSSANAIVHHENNITGKTRVFALPDGSQVRLSAASEITYSEPAGGGKREVVLNGEADFAVAKDKTKPFTVYSGDISTMAVGTRFTVTAFENDGFIQVKLLEGKVLVKPEKTMGNKPAENFYLLPGQLLVYDKNRQTAKIKSFRLEENTAGHTRQQNSDAHEDLLLPRYDKKSWFMFNNQSLPEIFHALELMYDVKIDYTKKDVDQRYFIGTFNKSDSVENILQQIAVLNKLTVTRKDRTFLVSRNK